MKKLPDNIVSQLKTSIIQNKNTNTILLSKYIQKYQFGNYAEYIQQQTVAPEDINDLCFFAVNVGNYDIAKDLLEHHGATYYSVYPYLRAAIVVEHIPLLELLLQYPVFNEKTPNRLGNDDAMNFLSNEEIDIHTDLVKSALRTENLEVVKILVENLSDINVDKVLISAAKRTTLDIFDYIVGKYSPDLHQNNYGAAILRKNRNDAAQCIIGMIEKYNININHVYSEKVSVIDHPSILHTLAKKPILNNNLSGTTYTTYSTILSEACYKNNLQLVDYLMNKGADINLGNSVAFEKALKYPELIKHLIVHHGITKTPEMESILQQNQMKEVLELFAVRDFADSLQADLPTHNVKSSRNKI